MTETAPPLSRTAASSAVESIGWRYLLAAYAASVPVPSLARGLEVASAASAACGPDADAHLRVDVRADRVELVLQTLPTERLTARDVELARAVSAAVAALGLSLAPPTGGTVRPVQTLEIAIDAVHIPSIRPFWKAVLGYVDEAGIDEIGAAQPGAELEHGLVDPARQGPTFWFQQMDAPRPDRNRIHFDITVSHDEAPIRLQAALDAGGVLLSDAAARAFWILADAEGNEICICTWQDRDDRQPL